MNYDLELESTLKELGRITGLPFMAQVKPEEVTQEMILSTRALLNAYKEKNNKDDVMKRWLLDRIAPEEFHDLMKKCHIASQEKRILYLISVREDHMESIMEVLRNMFPQDPDFWILPMSSSQIVLLQSFYRVEVSPKKTAYMIYNTLTGETMLPIKISYSQVTTHVDELPKWYKKTCFSMNVGETFSCSRDIYGYDNLGIGRLLYDIPEEHCEDYIVEILKDDLYLKKQSPIFRADMLNTVNCFLDNNLNIAETARQLHVHRNTLLYRIEQIERETGIDIRQFNDAMKYKLISMILLKYKVGE